MTSPCSTARARKQALERFRGSEVDRAGDGVFATFDGPARAIRCACEISREVRRLGLDIRAGIHTGECELDADRVSGIAVHIGARIAALAAPGEVLVSSTVKDLVAGSELQFRERGLTRLKGIPGEWRLHALLVDEPQASPPHAAAPGRTAALMLVDNISWAARGPNARFTRGIRWPVPECVWNVAGTSDDSSSRGSLRTSL